MTEALVGASRRAHELTGGSLAELFRLARARGAIDLAVGTPSFPETDEALIEAAAAAMRAGCNQYEDPAGDHVLREQIARSGATPADPRTEITVTVGATEAMCVAMLSTVDPGDEVIVLEPFYESYTGILTLAGAVARFVPLRRPDWRLDLDALAAAFGPRTRAIILNSPSNPTGQMLTRDELDGIAALCERWNVTVISDEVYAHLVFDDRPHVSVADVPRLRPHSIVIGSLSKYLAVSGWRLGYLRADAARTAVMRRVHEQTTLGAAAPLQRAAGQVGLLTSGRWLPAPGLAARRDRVQDILRKLGLRFAPAEGGCFLLADISAVTGADCDTFVRQVLDERGVLFVPGTSFFAEPARGRTFVRIAFNRAESILDAAERSLLP